MEAVTSIKTGKEPRLRHVDIWNAENKTRLGLQLHRLMRKKLRNLLVWELMKQSEENWRRERVWQRATRPNSTKALIFVQLMMTTTTILQPRWLLLRTLITMADPSQRRRRSVKAPLR